jgi:Mrp family chromosome partitioning ATPase
MEKIIQFHRSGDPVITDAFDQTVLHLCRQNERFSYKTLFLCGAEPAVGTTMIAIELSISLSMLGRKVLLIDCNMRKPSLYKHLSDGVCDGLGDYLRGCAEMEDIRYHTNWKSLWYIPSGLTDESNALQLLVSSRMH